MPTQTNTAPTTSAPVTNSLPPMLLAATPSGTAGDMSITLDFSTAMAAGSGTVFITDGAVQTVIDRATGLPTMRVVGATDTHTLAASSLVIDGTHVKLDVAGLLPGHTYSVVMGADVLQSAGHVAFGGVRSTSQLQFTTPAAPDTQGPTLVSVDTDGATLKAGGSIAVTLTFSEAVANLPAGALNAPHAAITGLSTADGGITWHATLAAPAEATTAAANVLTLDMGKVADAAGNHGSGTSNLASYAVDTQGPTATVTLDGTPLAAGHDAVATITFSEAVKDLPAAALSAGHATVSNVHTTDGGTTWLATLGGTAATTADGNVLAVDLGQVRDLAGNAGSGSASSGNYAVDTQGPSSVAIALDGATLTGSNGIHATFTFGEAVKELPLAAISAPHAHVTGLATADGGKTWTATLTADGTGTWTGNTVGVDLTKVRDLAGNAGSGGASSSHYVVDTQGPTATLALDSAALHTGSSATLTVQFSEAVKDLAATALQVPNGGLANLQHSADYKTWTATFTPQAGVTDASNAIGLDLTKVHDAAGNAGSGSASSGNYAVDTQGPSSVAIALDGATLAGSNGIHATFTFGEAVKDLPLAAVSAPHAHVTGLATADGGKTWTATLTADGTGTWTGNTVGVDLTKVQDLAGNAGSGSAASAAYTVDTVGPQVAAIGLAPTNLDASHAATLTIRFTEAVADLGMDAIGTPHAAVSGMRTTDGGITWTGTLASIDAAPSSGNVVTVDLAKVRDLAGNAGSGSAQSETYAVEGGVANTAAITLDGRTLDGGHAIVATIAFAQAVRDLPLAALSAPHASVSGLATTDGGKTWTVTLAASGSGEWSGNVLGVDLTQVQDPDGHPGIGHAWSGAYAVDTVGPQVAGIALDNTNLDATHGATLTIRFTEAVADLGMDAIGTPHAAVGDLRTTDGGITWTGTLASNEAAPSSGNVVTVDLAKVRDLAGNAGSGSAQSDTYAVAGGVASTAAITLDGTTLDGGHALVATVTFAQAVRDLPLAALSAPHASVSGLATTDGGKTWTVTLAASGSGEWSGNVLGVDLTQVRDLDGHPGIGHAWSGAYAVDTAGPAGAAIALGGGALDADGTLGVTFTFTEAVADLTAAAISAPGATVGDVRTTDGGKTWTAQLAATADVEANGLRVALDLGKVHDLHGNAGAGLAASDTSYAVDSKRPTVADILFDDTTLGPTHGIGFTITFSESVSGLTAAALQAPHAHVGNLATADGGKTWTGTLAAGEGATSSTGNLLRVDLTQVHDAAGNTGTGTAASLSHYDVNADVLTATVSLDGEALVSGGSVGVTIRFSAPVTTLDAAAFTTPHAALSNLHHSSDNLTWYATLSAADAGVVDTTNAVGLDLARVHDTLGNAGDGTASSDNYTLDTTVAAYVSQIYISDEGPYADDGVTNAGNAYVGGYFTGTLAGTQHLQVTIDDQEVEPDGLHVFEPADGLTAWYYSSEAYLSEGVHTFTARLVDDDGHASTTVSKQVTIDMTNPHLTASPDGSTAFDVAGNLVLTFDEAVYWKHGESRYDGLQLYDHDGGSIDVTLTEANFSSDHKTLTLTADELHLGTGNDYSLYLPYTLTDLAGNQVSYEGIGFHTAGTYVDVTPPTATWLHAVAGGDYGIGQTVAISVTFSEPVYLAGTDAPVLHLNNGAVATYLDTSADHRIAMFTYTVQAGDQDSAHLDIADRTGLAGHFADGAGHLLDLAHITFGYLADSDGETGSIRIDAHAPDAPPAPHLATWSDTGTPGDDITSVMAPAITGSGAEAFAKVDLYAGDRLAGTGWADETGNWTLSTVALGGNGTYTLKAVQYDDAGNASAPSQALTVTVAGAAAATAALDGEDDNGSATSYNLTNRTAPTLGGTVTAGAKVVVWDGSTKLGTATADGIGVWHLTPAYELANGQHTITLELTDTSGNVTPRELSTPFTFTIDSVAPDAPGTPVLAAGSDTGVSSTDGITKDTTPTLTGTAAESGGKVEVYEGETLLGSADVGNDGGWSFTLGADRALADGVHALTVRQVDAAGNRGAASAPLAITIDTTAPTIAAEHSYTKSLKNWHSLEFSEKIVFAANGAIDVFDTGNVGRSHHAWDVLTNWNLTTNEQGVPNTLELNLGTLNGVYHLQADHDAIQDVAGNAAIVGTPFFYVGVAS